MSKAKAKKAAAEKVQKASAKEGKPLSEKAAAKVAEKSEKASKGKESFGGKKAAPFAGPGIIQHLLSCVQKGGMTREDMQKSLEKNFPDRDPAKMHRTLLCQVGGNKRPSRMEREKKVEFIIKDGRYSLKK